MASRLPTPPTPSTTHGKIFLKMQGCAHDHATSQRPFNTGRIERSASYHTTASPAAPSSRRATRALAASAHRDAFATLAGSAPEPRARVCNTEHPKNAQSSLLTNAPLAWVASTLACAAGCPPNFSCPGGPTCGPCFPGYLAVGSGASATCVRTCRPLYLRKGRAN